MNLYILLSHPQFIFRLTLLAIFFVIFCYQLIKYIVTKEVKHKMFLISSLCALLFAAFSAGIIVYYFLIAFFSRPITLFFMIGMSSFFFLAIVFLFWGWIIDLKSENI